MADEQQERMRQRQQRIVDVLTRAADDPQLRHRLLDNPRSLLADPNDSTPPLPEHVQELRRQIIGQLVDRAAADPAFRQQLAGDLREAVRTAGLAPQMEQLRAELPAKAEVVGFSGWGGGWGWPDWGGGWSR
jgi:hypothetical protein